LMVRDDDTIGRGLVFCVLMNKALKKELFLAFSF
jgi:hypothetical protein